MSRTEGLIALIFDRLDDCNTVFTFLSRNSIRQQLTQITATSVRPREQKTLLQFSDLCSGFLCVKDLICNIMSNPDLSDHLQRVCLQSPGPKLNTEKQLLVTYHEKTPQTLKFFYKNFWYISLFWPYVSFISWPHTFYILCNFACTLHMHFELGCLKVL